MPALTLVDLAEAQLGHGGTSDITMIFSAYNTASSSNQTVPPGVNVSGMEKRNGTYVVLVWPVVYPWLDLCYRPTGQVCLPPDSTRGDRFLKAVHVMGLPMAPLRLLQRPCHCKVLHQECCRPASSAQSVGTTKTLGTNNSSAA